jgi:solute carrier family 45 protein 1/2/4
MSYSRPDDGSSSPSSSPLGSPPPPKIDTTSHNRPKPRPKLVSFGRDTSGGGRPHTEGRPTVNFIDEVDEHEPVGRTREMDPLLKESGMSPMDDDDDWQGEQQTEETKSTWFLFLLTFGGLGLQIGWSVETSNGSVSRPLCF